MINYIARICGSKYFWHDLGGKIINNTNLHIRNFRYTSLMHPGPLMFQSSMVFLENTDNDFLYYWLRRTNFPNVKKIIIDDGYIESRILDNFLVYGVHISTCSQPTFEEYQIDKNSKICQFPEMKNAQISLIDMNFYRKNLEKYQIEELSLTEPNF